jgi:hypothetical protein
MLRRPRILSGRVYLLCERRVLAAYSMGVYLFAAHGYMVRRVEAARVDDLDAPSPPPWVLRLDCERFIHAGDSVPFEYQDDLARGAPLSRQRLMFDEGERSSNGSCSRQLVNAWVEKLRTRGDCRQDDEFLSALDGVRAQLLKWLTACLHSDDEAVLSLRWTAACKRKFCVEFLTYKFENHLVNDLRH